MKKIIFLVITAGMLFSFFACSRRVHRWNADRSGAINEAYKVQDADKRLQDLHWFEDQYQLIQQTTIRYKNAQSEDVQALKNIVNGYIGQYNSRMRSYDRAMWANSDLPEKIQMIE